VTVKKAFIKKDKAEDSEFLHLEDVFKTEKKPKPHRNVNISTFKIIIHILWLSLYIVSCYTARQTRSAHSMVASIRSLIQGLPINYEGKTFYNIVSKADIQNFINEVILWQVYEESEKEFPAFVEGYHYVKNYNYFAGMRLT
jgi:hypothetical protein